MDSNVLTAQKYLNTMFGGHPQWEHLDEDGNTGTITMEGIVRAFQIHNNVSAVTGTVGPATIAKMKQLPVITKMNPEAPSDVNVCLIQCALFCKGYMAGGITGIFYNAGVAAIKEMQVDAGIPVTGTINWKVWAGLLSLYWFKLVDGGKETVQLIQRQLNADWSDVIGVGPCDGIMSRHTALSLIGALQAAEGVTTELIPDLSEVNFGNATTAAFPTVLKVNKNEENDIPFNKLVQYALYFTGFDPWRYDGIFDYNTHEQVAAFQKFYALTDIGLVTPGEVNVATMKSLLVSKGETGRRAKACDCSTVLNKQQALDIKKAGYTHVGRYLTGSVGDNFIPKYITKEEGRYIQEADLSIFPIYQDGGWYLNYFKNAVQGAYDAETATKAAKDIGIPAGTTIYFAVDFDCLGHEVESHVIPYFQKLKYYFESSCNTMNYKLGIYAPRYVCTLVGNAGLVDSSFVADMSTGFSGNLGYPLPDNWAFDQFHEESFTSAPSFPIDKVAYSGRDVGFSSFDTVATKTDKEILQEQVDDARYRFACQVCQELNFLDKMLSFGFSLNKEFPVALVQTADAILSVKFSVNAGVVKPGESDHVINIRTSEGSLTAGCASELDELSSIAVVYGFDTNQMIKNIALSIKTGYVTFSVTEIHILRTAFSITFNVPNLLPEDFPLDSSISFCFSFSITATDTNKIFFEEEYAKEYLRGVALAGLVLAGTGAIASEALGVIGATVLQSLFNILSSVGVLVFS